MNSSLSLSNSNSSSSTYSTTPRNVIPSEQAFMRNVKRVLRSAYNYLSSFPGASAVFNGTIHQHLRFSMHFNADSTIQNEQIPSSESPAFFFHNMPQPHLALPPPSPSTTTTTSTPTSSHSSVSLLSSPLPSSSVPMHMTVPAQVPSFSSSSSTYVPVSLPLSPSFVPAPATSTSSSHSSVSLLLSSPTSSSSSSSSSLHTSSVSSLAPQCIICSEPALSDRLPTSLCGNPSHGKICFGCLVTYIKTKMEDGSLSLPLRCPGLDATTTDITCTGITGHMIEDILKQMNDNDEDYNELKNKWHFKQVQLVCNEETSTDIFLQCSLCPAIQHFDKSISDIPVVIHCSSCPTLYCTGCKETIDEDDEKIGTFIDDHNNNCYKPTFHDRSTSTVDIPPFPTSSNNSNTNTLSLDTYINKCLSRNVPHCPNPICTQLPIEKMDGCNSIICDVCKWTWCFLCGKRIITTFGRDYVKARKQNLLLTAYSEAKADPNKPGKEEANDNTPTLLGHMAHFSGQKPGEHQFSPEITLNSLSFLPSTTHRLCVFSMSMLGTKPFSLPGYTNIVDTTEDDSHKEEGCVRFFLQHRMTLIIKTLYHEAERANKIQELRSILMNRFPFTPENVYIHNTCPFILQTSSSSSSSSSSTFPSLSPSSSTFPFFSSSSSSSNPVHFAFHPPSQSTHVAHPHTTLATIPQQQQQQSSRQRRLQELAAFFSQPWHVPQPQPQQQHTPVHTNAPMEEYARTKNIEIITLSDDDDNETGVNNEEKNDEQAVATQIVNPKKRKINQTTASKTSKRAKKQNKKKNQSDLLRVTLSRYDKDGKCVEKEEGKINRKEYNNVCSLKDFTKLLTQINLEQIHSHSFSYISQEVKLDENIFEINPHNVSISISMIPK